ncbi:hypothetical protein [Fluviicola taffensis]|uniref:hypothetical protein n=1 Tax=Fluviicola taffensis TaxID=191579 RepID=UPI003137B008
MATIKNLELKVVRGKTKNRAKISLKFDVSFTQAERTHRLKFGMYAGIYEIDYAEDSSILPIPNGYESLSILNLKSTSNKPTNSEDDFITWLTPQVINPNGRTKINYALEAEILVKNRNVSDETFKAFVYVIPEIFAGFGWSEKATIPKETTTDTPPDVKQEPVKEVKDGVIAEQKTPPQETKPKPIVKSKIVKKAAPKIVKQAQPKA